MSDLPKCRLCGCDPWFDEDGDYGHPAGSDCVLASAFYMTEQEWNKLMTQQQADQDRLRFQSACEISGDKHPEYVRGYEAAMDAVCKTQRFTATDEAQPAPIPTAWQPIETAPTDVFHVRGLWVHDKDGAPLYFETDAGFVDDDGHCFIDSAGNVYGWAAYQYTHWHPLDVPPAPGCSDD